jgi:hypothetical protein
MTTTRHHRRAATLALAAAALVFATAAAGAGAAAKPQAQRFTLYTANLRGKDVPVVVEAAGPISGIGTETQSEKDTSAGQVNYVKLHFAGGTIRLVAPERFAWKPNLRTCSATAAGGGTWKLTGGTGAYSGVVGRGTFTSHGVLLGARSANGACLGEKAPPTANYVSVTLTGTISI